MSKQNNLTDFLTDVANAIRVKKGSTDLINPQNFSAEIAALSGGLEVIDMTETTATIEPNKVYVWGMVESLDITLGASTDESDFFAFRFRCSKPTMTVVTVNGATWAEDTELDAGGKPVLDLGSWYQCEIKGGTSALYARLAHYIPFADSNVEAVLLAKGVGDGLGVTYKDAAQVTSISTWFKDNGVITSFDELKYFTNITTLGASTFQNCLNLEKVNLDNIVKLTGYNGAGAFYNSGIKEVSLPKLSVIENSYCCEFQSSLVERILSLGKITAIPNGSANYGFCRNCTLLTYVNLPDTLTSIGNYAFYGCSSLAEITLPAGLTSIGVSAFERCTSLSSRVLPEGLTTISQSAFVRCSALSLVIDLPNLTTLGKDAFSLADVTRVENLGKISSIEDAASGNYGMFRGNVNLTYVNLPDTLTSIGNYAFYGCSSLAEITLPAGLTSIGNYAFYGCTSLPEITLPAGLTSIGVSAFERCTSLSSRVLPEGLTTISQGAFVRCSALSLVIDLPNLTTLGKDAFSLADVTRVENLGKISSIEDAASGNYGMFRGNVNLTYVNLPDTLTSIGNYAFYGCSSLAEITLPAGLTSIGGRTFIGCTSLTRVVNLENTKVTSIEDYAFNGCSSLAEITLPAGVTSIGNYAFNGCKSLQYIRIEATTPPTLSSTNAIPSSIGAIYVPDGSVAAYQAATNWSSFASKIKGISEMPA